MFRFETLSDLIVGILVTLSFNHVVLTQANLAQHNIYYWCSGASAAPNFHVPAKESRGIGKTQQGASLAPPYTS